MNLGYTGKPYDPATGLYNYGFRDYQAAAERFFGLRLKEMGFEQS